ncbi:hypothetical protein EJ110_NYTH49021 [Nymphaea thermarum]|nr:hypothetical protein EJ110_NYTH49021 [Nymphaea thermarum]
MWAMLAAIGKVERAILPGEQVGDSKSAGGSKGTGDRQIDEGSGSRTTISGRELLRASPRNLLASMITNSKIDESGNLWQTAHSSAAPKQASFFISYVATSGWTSLLLELIRIIPLLSDIIKRHCSKTAGHDFSVPSLSYHGSVPKILFFALLGITYSFLAPLILPFLLFYFSLGYVTYRNQLLNVYMPKFETCGKFWPIVHSALVFSLILMQAIAIGIFALKKLALASSLTIPLPVLTLIFSWYCRKRFLSMFNTYSAEISRCCAIAVGSLAARSGWRKVATWPPMLPHRRRRPAIGEAMALPLSKETGKHHLPHPGHARQASSIGQSFFFIIEKWLLGHLGRPQPSEQIARLLLA